MRDEEQSGCLYLVTGDLQHKMNAEFGKTGSLQFLNYTTPPPFFLTLQGQRSDEEI